LVLKKDLKISASNKIDDLDGLVGGISADPTSFS